MSALQFSTIAVIEDVTRCVTMDIKLPGDLVYVLGVTHNELGGSEYHQHFGYVGLNVPRVRPEEFMDLYRALSLAIDKELVASAHGIYRGGLGVHLALAAMGGDLGLQADLGLVPVAQVDRNDVILFSESAGRFIVTIDPQNKASFETLFKDLDYACIGSVTAATDVVIKGLDGSTLIDVGVDELKAAWKKPFGDLI